MAHCELTIWFTAHRMTWFQKMRDVRLMEDTNRVAYDLRMNDGSLDSFRLLFFCGLNLLAGPGILDKTACSI